jgi:hypothetical protein
MTRASMERIVGTVRGDARMLQVAFLAAFLAFILAFRDFTLPAVTMGLVVVTALATQGVLTRLLGLPPAGPLSPLISSLSLCLLLRTNEPWIGALAAMLSIASKFLLRVHGKHVFNPTNFGILATIVLTGGAWIAPSQWGSAALLAFAVAALGMAVASRARRLDIALAFLAFHLGLKLLRVLLLAQRLAVFEHQALSGAVILFAFFMISDPRSTPDARSMRIAFAFVVACVSHVLQFRLFWNDAPLWALLFVSPLSPILDRIRPHARFEWRAGGNPDASQASPRHPRHVPGRPGDVPAFGLLRLLRREG